MTTSASDEVLSRLTTALERAQKEESLELEIRIGQYRDGTFTSGVTRSHMDRIVQALNANDAVCPTNPNMKWEEVEDFFFTDASSRRLRTRVSFDNDRMCMSSTTIQKQLIDQFIIRTHALDARISLAAELAVDNVPHAVKPTFVRIKQVRQYNLKTSPFVIDCSAVWSGSKRSHAEKKQSEEDGVFELECEYLPDKTNCDKYPTTKEGRNRLAKSFLYKIADIMLSTKVHFEMA